MNHTFQDLVHRAARGAARFFSSQAKLSLISLMILSGLVIALAPIAFSYLAQAKTPQRPVASGARGVDQNSSDLTARCNQVLVSFSKGATISQIASLLEKLDSSIVFGPNENGNFELLVPATRASEVVDALNRSEGIVIVASKRDRCL